MKVNLRPRLKAVFDMLDRCGTLADVGCDHGRLSAALLQSGNADFVIASDISMPSLGKACVLAEKCGFTSRIEFVCSDGLSHLANRDINSIAIAGMGGELIAQILDNNESISRRTQKIVMQPMRGIYELRKFLYCNNYRISDECIVYDANRYYQIIAASNGIPDALPTGFPCDAYEFGAISAIKSEPLLLPMLEQYLAGHKRRMDKAQKRGSTPPALVNELETISAMIRFVKEMQ